MQVYVQNCDLKTTLIIRKTETCQAEDGSIYLQHHEEELPPDKDTMITLHNTNSIIMKEV